MDKKMMFKLYILLIAVTTVFISTCVLYAEAAENIAGDKVVAAANSTDAHLADFQNKLIELAFDTACAIPVKPHQKDRSKTQEAVFDAYLKLDQPVRALGTIEKINDWRGGLCYGKLAFYYARKGDNDKVSDYLKLAAQYAEQTEDWRRDRIRVLIAQTRVLQGHNENIKKFEEDLTESEFGKISNTQAMICDDESFNSQVVVLDEYIAAGGYDLIKNALDAYSQLFNRFYNDDQKRTIAEDKIKASWNALPIFVRIELMIDLAGYAAGHKDNVKAVEIINEAQEILGAYALRPEHKVEMAAKLVKIRYSAGDTDKAAADADKAFEYFDAECEKIVNIYRCQALTGLAEAYQLMGNRDKALTVYKRCLKESLDNPNSRPRAEDLSSVCRSMALYKVEPDEQLWDTMRQIREGLGNPW